MDEQKLHAEVDVVVEQIVQALPASGPADLGALFTSTHAPLSRFATWLLNSYPALRRREGSQDLLQDLWTSVLEVHKRREAVPTPTQLRHQLRQQFIDTIRHAEADIRDIRREKSPSPASPHGDSSAPAVEFAAPNQLSPSEEAVNNDRLERFGAAMRSLAPPLADVVRLRCFERLSNAEVARQLSLSQSAASEAYYEGLSQINAILQEQGTSFSFSPR